MTLHIDFPPEKEKEVLSVLKALGVTIAKEKSDSEKDRVFSAVKQGLKEVELHQQGKIELQSAEDFLNEL